MMTAYIDKISYYIPELTKALSESGIMIMISIVAAVVLGLPIGTFVYLTKKTPTKSNHWIGIFLNGYINIVRSFPFLLFVVALIPFTRFVLGTAFGTYAAALPLSFVAVAIYARLVEQVLLEMPNDILELARSLGSTKFQLIFRFLYVEARSGLVLALTSVIISMVSYSTVMGVIGGGGIGDFALRYGYQRYEYAVMYTAIVLMIIFVSLIQVSGSWLAKKINKK
ncbi:D-methionine transport system permease [Enterococcus sp. DIV0840]|uniref:methionine ABC transporter permease n=1 Tax=Enterococcus TaxID=1350 RepID=UPI001A8FD27F|nr:MULTISPECIES: methionine ABC transporter permease [Enterococcus]MBO0434401.1 ABC transporter permease [Enterococcus sp. DIV0849a]MBO0474066.1 ABC transporter permease [Enterococcus ureasiticus]